MNIEVKFMTEEQKNKRIQELIEAGHDEETIRMTVQFEDAGREFFKGGVIVGNPERIKYVPENMARALLEVQGYKPNF